ncbi:MAG: class D beta-lactamase [Bacteroidetes bacterium]|nr:class D beta-lactamase [Bacteroidota bacterium]
MRSSIIVSLLAIFLFASCRESRLHEKPEWGKYFEQEGLKDACFILRDHNHETVYFYNKERCLKRFTPASTFKIFNSLVALETAVAPDDELVIKWDSVVRDNADWNKDMNMREAFKVSCVPYYQEIARRIGAARMAHYVDTANYGNKNVAGAIDMFWLNDSLQISADEQVGFLKRMYFAELPFSERSQRIVKNMMLQEETPQYKLYYKTGWGHHGQSDILWVVGFIEKIEHVKEHANSMNKSDMRMYPYFFAMNFDVPENDTTKDWAAIRTNITKAILKDFGTMSAEAPKQ